jgi:DNA invertase Pin-like site-specific DNA recombinase
VVGIYEDVMSGAKASRPALNKLMSDARAKKFDCLLVWKLDRFGRSLVDCLNNLQVLENCGIRFIAGEPRFPAPTMTAPLDTPLKTRSMAWRGRLRILRIMRCCAPI